MPINPYITDKIKNDNQPEKIKQVLNEILKREDEMEIEGAQKDYKQNIAKILEKYADDDEIKKFCERYE